MDADLGRAPRGPSRRRLGPAPARWATLALIFGTLAGCGGPTLARLDKGTFARAESSTREPIPVYFHKGEEVVPPGTPVQILSDAEGAIGDTDRHVLVAFRAGPHEGIGAFVRRRDLRPDPK